MLDWFGVDVRRGCTRPELMVDKRDVSGARERERTRGGSESGWETGVCRSPRLIARGWTLRLRTDQWGVLR